MLFGTSVSDNPPPFPPADRCSPLDVCPFGFEILCTILLLASFVHDLRWSAPRTFSPQFIIYFSYVTLADEFNTGSINSF